MLPRSLLLGLCLSALSAGPGAAQVPGLDPFYQGETARPTFFGGVAVSGELAYRATDVFSSALGTPADDGLEVAARLDYRLFQQVDLSAIVDLSGGLGPGPVRLSWLALTPRWRRGGTDYAIRIAVDPASEGGGFRQTDVAFLSSTLASARLSSHFVLGLRRARVGFDRVVLDTEVDPVLGDIEPREGRPGAARTRALGREVHLAYGGSYALDPAGSGLSLTLHGEAGWYTLLQTTTDDTLPVPVDVTREARIRGALGWARVALAFNRPDYVVEPSLALPVFGWSEVDGASSTRGPRLDGLRAGLRVMLR